mgnify:CR=1 FL=1|tara:strand:+ start:10149 stop:10406 length:258 start_codon:yes stop_codon:yes gene_type:complete
MTATPTSKLRIINPDDADREMRAYAQRLQDAEERPWFEVRWPNPSYSGKTYEEWEADQEGTYDAVELIDGEFHTLPPYAELEAAQ